MGLIYCFTNLHDENKSYIGLTTQSLEQRIKKHLSQINDNSYFHRALKKYGLESFKIEILEDNIPNDKLKEREIYWIEKKKTYVDDGGYNLTRGGDTVSKTIQKLKDKEVIEIKKLLKNSILTEQQIADKYNVSIYTISDINIGKSWYEDSINYPIRKSKEKELTYNNFLLIIEMLKTHMFSSQYISKKVDITNSVVSNINTGKYKKFPYPKGIVFSIQPYKIVTNKTSISTENTLLLFKDWITNEKITRQQLADKYGISLSHIKTLLNNNKNHCFDDMLFPLRNNPDFNLKKIEEKLSVIKLYS